MRKVVVFLAGLLAGVALMLVSQNLTAPQAGAVESFSQFLERVETSEVKKVTFTGDKIAYVTMDGKTFATTAPPSGYAYQGLTNRLVQRGIVVSAKDPLQ